MKHTVPYILISIAAACVLASCAGGPSIPDTRKGIMDSFVAGTLDPSYAPAAFFIHFGSDQKVGDPAVPPPIRSSRPTPQAAL